MMRYRRYKQKSVLTDNLRELDQEITKLKIENQRLMDQIYAGCTFKECMAIAAYMKTHGLDEYRISFEAVLAVQTDTVIERNVDVFKREHVFALRATHDC